LKLTKNFEFSGIPGSKGEPGLPGRDGGSGMPGPRGDRGLNGFPGIFVKYFFKFIDIIFFSK